MSKKKKNKYFAEKAALLKKTDSHEVEDFERASDNDDAKHIVSYEPQKQSLPRFAEFDLTEFLAEHYCIGLYGDALFIKKDDIFEPLIEPYAVAAALQNILSSEDAARFTIKKCAGVLERLRSLEGIRENELEVNSNYVAFQNGTFKISNFKPVSSDKNHFILFKINAEFHQEQFFDTPHFDDFIYTTSGGDKEIADLILYTMAYLLMHGTPAKKFFIFGPAPDSGKSILASFMEELIGKKNCSAIPLQSIGKDFIAARIVGKAANFSMDLPRSGVKFSAVSTLKMLTGHDTITVNPKFRSVFEYSNLAKLVFGTNHPVTLVEHDDAFWNRAVIVPFLYTVPKHERDPKLLKKLLKERNGIVQKLMFYAQDLYNNDFNFPYCRESERLKCEWAQNSSSFVTQFIETECEFDDKAFTSTRALLEAYREFSGDDGTSENVFSRILHKQIGLRPDRRKVKGVQSRGFVGIRLQEKDNGMYNIEIS